MKMVRLDPLLVTKRRKLENVQPLAALGVERTHLWRVLTGQRQSRSLLRRYQAFVAG